MHKLLSFSARQRGGQDGTKLLDAPWPDAVFDKNPRETKHYVRGVIRSGRSPTSSTTRDACAVCALKARSTATSIRELHSGRRNS